MFLEASVMERAISSFVMKEECKRFCVNLIMWSTVAQESANTLFFYIFEYGAESGAKLYFIHNVLHTTA